MARRAKLTIQTILAKLGRFRGWTCRFFKIAQREQVLVFVFRKEWWQDGFVERSKPFRQQILRVV